MINENQRNLTGKPFTAGSLVYNREANYVFRYNEQRHNKLINSRPQNFTPVHTQNIKTITEQMNRK